MKPTARKIIMAVAACVFVFSGVMLLRHQLQMRASAKCAETIAQTAIVFPTKDSPLDVFENAPFEVKFYVLFEQNEDIIAWIYAPNTPINYPIVQTSDNDYYLRRLLDGRYNFAGTLFMDYRNAADFSDWNSLIYGHNMKNETMFGSLHHYKSQAYFDEHPYLYLFTAEQNYKIRVLAGFVTSSDAEVYNAFDADAEEQRALIAGWMETSDFDSGLEVADGDRLITLSTCSYDYANARYVLVGILEDL